MQIGGLGWCIPHINSSTKKVKRAPALIKLERTAIIVHCAPFQNPSHAPFPKSTRFQCVTTHSNSCTNQLTGIHLSQTESSLSGHTSIYMVKHQISTRVVHRSSAIAPTGCWSPSMYLSDAQWRILRRSELYQFKALS